ncbi:MAG TPA: ABC transporter permease [Candidatus Dormibacteraeota bacterium]|jgi:peptide/nickel transport system permease protein|nr:ABC transporter permease [Candidatus Dormibacteraeota bacterium]
MLAKYVARRFLASVVVVLGVTLITLVLMDRTRGTYVPGIDLNPSLRPEDIEHLRANLGLDRPFYVWYLTWMWAVLHGDFGHSMIDGSPVLSHILDRLPNTLELTATAIVIGVLIAIPLGVVGALRHGSKTDHGLTVLSVAGFAVPQFWMGLMLILIFSVTLEQHGLPWLPSSGAFSAFNGGDLLDRLAHLILPATVLSFFYTSIWSRFVRSSMLEVLSQDYIRTARAKGMSERRVVYLHGLRNALIPLITLIGLELPGLVSGGLVVEVVFGWPGIGKLAFERALQYDYTTVMGVTFFATILVIAGNLLADLLYGVLDPRIRYG